MQQDNKHYKIVIMKTRSKVVAITSGLLIATLVILCAVWWVNGRDDTWFYATSALIAVSAFIPLLSKQKHTDK
jgi:hypothetical protein